MRNCPTGQRVQADPLRPAGLLYPGPAPAPLPPTGYAVDAAPPGDTGAALVGRTVLYWWQDDGWQRDTVTRLCPLGSFSHVVAYTLQTSALRGTVDTLLDAASYGTRWVLLSPAPAAGVARVLRPRAPRP